MADSESPWWAGLKLRKSTASAAPSESTEPAEATPPDETSSPWGLKLRKSAVSKPEVTGSPAKDSAPADEKTPSDETSSPWGLKLRKSTVSKPEATGSPAKDSASPWANVLKNSPEDGRESARASRSSCAARASIGEGSSRAGNISQRRLEKAKHRAATSPSRSVRNGTSTSPSPSMLEALPEEEVPSTQATSGAALKSHIRQPDFDDAARPSSSGLSVAEVPPSSSPSSLPPTAAPADSPADALPLSVAKKAPSAVMAKERRPSHNKAAAAAAQHDVDLSRLLSKLLRHKAIELGVAITSDGWVALPDAIAQANGAKLRQIVGNEEQLAGRQFTDADVRLIVQRDNKQRFELLIGGGARGKGLIRCSQGHTMAGIACEIGVRLDEATAPAYVVHGSYLDHLQPILTHGLSRMRRNHIHLAKGLLGEKSIISGMRTTCELFIWIDVRRAIRDGYRFFESSNGVVLCDGKNDDGRLPPDYFSVVIELRGGLVLKPAQVRLLERLFSGCSRVVCVKMHGGFSGSLVLRTDSFNALGQREEPTVTKLDDGRSMVHEVQQTRVISDLVGDEAIKVMRGPLFLGPDGEEKEGSAQALDLIDAAIDGPLLERIRDGTILLIKCKWLISPEADAALSTDPHSGAPVMRRRQELPEEAFMSAAEAEALLMAGTRSVLALSHCWQVPSQPDPHGHTLKIVRRYLRGDERAQECGLFWDWASLPQKDLEGNARSPKDEAIFRSGLTVMASCYASCSGTSVLQVKEVPERPPQYDGMVIIYKMPAAISSVCRPADAPPDVPLDTLAQSRILAGADCLALSFDKPFDKVIQAAKAAALPGLETAALPEEPSAAIVALYKRWSAHQVKLALIMHLAPYMHNVAEGERLPPMTKAYGSRLSSRFQNSPTQTKERVLIELIDVELVGAGAVITFSTHAGAMLFVEGIQQSDEPAQQWAASLLYNSRSYEANDHGDVGRGWTIFEQGTGLIVAAHLKAAEKKGLLSKRFVKAQDSRHKLIDLSHGQVVAREDVPHDVTRVLEKTKRDLLCAQFTGKGDKEFVCAQLEELDLTITRALEQWAVMEEELATEEDCGAVLLEMAGACWVLPEFHNKLEGVELISTFKKKLVAQLAAESHGGAVVVVDALSVLRELWGAGAPLNNMALRTAARAEVLATAPGGLLELETRGIVESLVIVFLAPEHDPQCQTIAQAARYGGAPPKLRACLEQLLAAHPLWLAEVVQRRNFVRMFDNSFVLETRRGLWDDAACAVVIELLGKLLSLSHDSPSLPAWMLTWRSLVTYQHGDLNCANILVDVRSSLWLIDFAKAGLNNPFLDAAKMVSVVLFEHFPIPLTVDELHRSTPSKLMTALECKEAVAERLHELAAPCHSKADLEAAVDQETDPDLLRELRQQLPRLADAKLSEQRLDEACEVVRLLLAPEKDGEPPELWQVARRQPPQSWPAHAQLAHRICTSVLSLTCELVAKTSTAEQAAAHGQAAECAPADLHAANFLLPLLIRALCSIRYVQLGAAQKRLAWFASQHISAALLPVLDRPPVTPPNFDVTEPEVLQLAPWLPMALLTHPEGRLDGGEGGTSLVIAGLAQPSPPLHAQQRSPHSTPQMTPRRMQEARAPPVVTSLHVIREGPTPPRVVLTLSLRPKTFDGCSQVVLPWFPPKSQKLTDEALGSARLALGTLPRLRALVGSLRERLPVEEVLDLEGLPRPRTDDRVTRMRATLPKFTTEEYGGSVGARVQYVEADGRRGVLGVISAPIEDIKHKIQVEWDGDPILRWVDCGRLALIETADRRACDRIVHSEEVVAFAARAKKELEALSAHAGCIRFLVQESIGELAEHAIYPEQSRQVRASCEAERATLEAQRAEMATVVAEDAMVRERRTRVEEADDYLHQWRTSVEENLLSFAVAVEELDGDFENMCASQRKREKAWLNKQSKTLEVQARLAQIERLDERERQKLRSEPVEDYHQALRQLPVPPPQATVYASGLRWQPLGDKKPVLKGGGGGPGSQLVHGALAAALGDRWSREEAKQVVTFSPAEWEAFGIPTLLVSHYVECVQPGGALPPIYFRPAADERLRDYAEEARLLLQMVNRRTEFPGRFVFEEIGRARPERPRNEELLNAALADALLAAEPVQINPVQLAFSYDAFVQLGGAALARKLAKGDYIHSNGTWYGAIALAELEKEYHKRMPKLHKLAVQARLLSDTEADERRLLLQERTHLEERRQQIDVRKQALAKLDEQLDAVFVSLRNVYESERESHNALVTALSHVDVDASDVADLCMGQLGTAGLRVYAPGQRLIAYSDGWVDVTVIEAASAMSDTHRLREVGDAARELTLKLHPFNHAPRVLPSADFDNLRGRYYRMLSAQHASIVDALSGRRLDVFNQCVPIEVSSGASKLLARVSDVSGLALYFSTMHSMRLQGSALSMACVLLSAGPAAGKTCLMSQLVMHCLKRRNELVPILVKVQQLQRCLLRDIEPLERRKEAHQGERKRLVEHQQLEVKRLADEQQRAKKARDDALDAELSACRKEGSAQGLTRTQQDRKLNTLRRQHKAVMASLLHAQGESTQEQSSRHERERKRLDDKLHHFLASSYHTHVFATSWNWIDAYLRVTYGARSDLYRMLRQALMARRALVLLDGIDEGGRARAAIEKHVVEVLAPQGHLMLVTSRPAGLKEDLYRSHFNRLQLRPLTDEQQEQVIQQRLGNPTHASELRQYVNQHAPVDPLGHRVTGNPLMLSMIISIYESRVQAKQSGAEAVALRRRASPPKSGASPHKPRERVSQAASHGMPATMAELYGEAATAMLERVDRKERGAAASVAAVPYLTALLEATFFQAHASLRRVIEDEHLESAALELTMPAKLAAIQWPAHHARAQVGEFVEVLRGSHAGQRGVVTRDDQDSKPFTVQLMNGQQASWLEESAVRSSGLNEVEFEQRYGVEARRARVREACESLPLEMAEALRAIRQRVAQDRLPLLTLLQADPLQMQSSHLSFQEYYAARALCGKTRLPGSPPWQWPSWWQNALNLGIQMGDEFRRGLMRASCGETTTLDLNKKLGMGDAPTTQSVVVQLCKVAHHVDIGQNDLGDERIDKMLAELEDNVVSLGLSANQMRAAGASSAAAYIARNPNLTSIDLSRNFLVDQDLVLGAYQGKYNAHGLNALVEACNANPSMRVCNLLGNGIDTADAQRLTSELREGVVLSGIGADQVAAEYKYINLRASDATLLASGLCWCTSLQHLSLAYNRLGDEGVLCLCAGLTPELALESLDLEENRIGADASRSLAHALARLPALSSVTLDKNNLGDEGAEGLALAFAYYTHDQLSSLSLKHNQITPHGLTQLARSLVEGSTRLSRLDLTGNRIGGLWTEETRVGQRYVSGQLDTSGVNDLIRALHARHQKRIGLCGLAWQAIKEAWLPQHMPRPLQNEALRAALRKERSKNDLARKKEAKREQRTGNSEEMVVVKLSLADVAAIDGLRMVDQSSTIQVDGTYYQPFIDSSRSFEQRNATCVAEQPALGMPALAISLEENHLNSQESVEKLLRLVQNDVLVPAITDRDVGKKLRLEGDAFIEIDDRRVEVDWVGQPKPFSKFQKHATEVPDAERRLQSEGGVIRQVSEQAAGRTPFGSLVQVALVVRIATGIGGDTAQSWVETCGGRPVLALSKVVITTGSQTRK